MIGFPNAKINLGLHVVERRLDGYHNIQTIFFPIPLHDILEVIPSSKQFSFINYGLSVNVAFEENICVKAYKLLSQQYKLPPVEIHLYKNIPFGAGLGGGSSDAAHTLILLNKLYNLGICKDELKMLSAQLGSDCAFFMENHPCYATGRGEQLEVIDLNLSGKYIVLVKPPIHVSTSVAYKNIVPQKPYFNLKNITTLPIEIWKEVLVNDFEKNVFRMYPLLSSIKEQLYKLGAIYAAMSGSGSTLYGIFDKEISTDNVFPDYFTWKCKL